MVHLLWLGMLALALCGAKASRAFSLHRHNKRAGKAKRLHRFPPPIRLDASGIGIKVTLVAGRCTTSCVSTVQSVRRSSPSVLPQVDLCRSSTSSSTLLLALGIVGHLLSLAGSTCRHLCLVFTTTSLTNLVTLTAVRIVPCIHLRLYRSLHACHLLLAHL